MFSAICALPHLTVAGVGPIACAGRLSRRQFGNYRPVTWNRPGTYSTAGPGPPPLCAAARPTVPIPFTLMSPATGFSPSAELDRRAQEGSAADERTDRSPRPVLTKSGTVVSKVPSRTLTRMAGSPWRVSLDRNVRPPTLFETWGDLPRNLTSGPCREPCSAPYLLLPAKRPAASRGRSLQVPCRAGRRQPRSRTAANRPAGPALLPSSSSPGDHAPAAAAGFAGYRAAALSRRVSYCLLAVPCRVRGDADKPSVTPDTL